MRDRLFLLRPGFADPAFPGQLFYCWHCALMEGVLSSFPWLCQRIDVVRIDWPRPRHDLIAEVGEDNQSAPLLLLGDDAPLEVRTATFGSRRFVVGKEEILKALSQRHGLPIPHP